MNSSSYLDSFFNLKIENIRDKIIAPEDDDEYSLADIYSQSGCADHANSGYDNHSNSGYDNAYSSGCTDYHQVQAYCTDSGYDNHSQSYSCNQGPGIVYSNCSAVAYTAYGNYTVCSQTGCSTHTQTCYELITSGYNNHTNTGYNNHSNSGYDNHSNSGYSNHVNYTNNYDPVLSGVITNTGGPIFNNSIPIAWPAATDTLASGQSAQTITYYLYYKYRIVDGVWGTWLDIANTTALTYNWNTTTAAAGEYMIKVRAFDGLEWNDLGTSDPNAVASIGLESGILSVVHYQAPSWANVIGLGEKFSAAARTEIKTEINKARVAVGLAEYAFSTAEIVYLTEITTLREKSQDARTTVGKGTFTWTTTPALNGNVSPGELLDIRSLLEDF